MVGIAQALLMQSKDVFAGKVRSKNVRTPGYLKMLIDNELPNVLSSTVDSNGTGHIKDVKIRYKNRVKAGQTVTTDDCSVQAQPVYLETTVGALSFRKYSMFFDDTLIRRYETEASQGKPFGSTNTPVMNEVWDSVLDAANGLFADINTDLLAAQAAAYGVNAVTGTSAAVTLNFPLSTITSNLSEGMNKLMADMLFNEADPTQLVIVGSGLIASYYMQNAAVPQTPNANGIDRTLLVNPEFYHDPYAKASWGTNQFGAFEKGTVRLINVNRFGGAFSGDKLKTILGTINLPVMDTLGGNQLKSFKFDFQLRYNDCPGTMTIGGVAGVTVGRGWILDLMANYTQFNIPSDVYATGDPMRGNNGTYRYTATNA